MKIAVMGAKSYDECFLQEANKTFGHELVFFEPRLSFHTAPLAAGFPAVCAFVNDTLDAPVLESLAASQTRLVALRCAGFNNVDLKAAQKFGVKVCTVPA